MNRPAPQPSNVLGDPVRFGQMLGFNIGENGKIDLQDGNFMGLLGRILDPNQESGFAFSNNGQSFLTSGPLAKMFEPFRDAMAQINENGKTVAPDAAQPNPMTQERTLAASGMTTATPGLGGGPS